MPQMAPNEAAVIDPILTAVARGYGSPNAKIADILFPRVDVTSRSGTIIVFPPDAFQLVNSARAPGANTKRIRLGYGKGKYSLVDHALEGEVPIETEEEAQTVPGIDLGSHAVNTVQDVMGNEREKLAADLALNPANYDNDHKVILSSTDFWTNSASNPFEVLNEGREAIRKSTGKKPNVLTLSPKALLALRNHPKVMDRISITVDRVPASIEQLQRLFEIERIVEGEATYHDGKEFQDMWGLDAILAFTVPKPQQQRGSPNYGYTYQLKDRPNVEQPYYERNPRTWFYPVNDAYQPELVGASAGFLIQNAGKGA
ncbi:major capsid protein [Comamonas terrae]|uniref:Major capsid protein n=1 Tax=Comamonas terrae TaxID=673548 RepID=A0ABW5UKX6_9BURK|nr:major capsid protein [Comamonas terrae]